MEVQRTNRRPWLAILAFASIPYVFARDLSFVTFWGHSPVWLAGGIPLVGSVAYVLLRFGIWRLGRPRPGAPLLLAAALVGVIQFVLPLALVVYVSMARPADLGVVGAAATAEVEVQAAAVLLLGVGLLWTGLLPRWLGGLTVVIAAILAVGLAVSMLVSAVADLPAAALEIVLLAGIGVTLLVTRPGRGSESSAAS